MGRKTDKDKKERQTTKPIKPGSKKLHGIKPPTRSPRPPKPPKANRKKEKNEGHFNSNSRSD